MKEYYKIQTDHHPHHAGYLQLDTEELECAYIEVDDETGKCIFSKGLYEIKEGRLDTILAVRDTLQSYMIPVRDLLVSNEREFLIAAGFL